MDYKAKELHFYGHDTFPLRHRWLPKAVKHVRETNKSRSFYSAGLNNITQNLPLLKNDTNNIIEYINDVEVYKKKKKKYTFWDLIGK